MSMRLPFAYSITGFLAALSLSAAPTAYGASGESTAWADAPAAKAAPAPSDPIDASAYTDSIAVFRSVLAKKPSSRRARIGLARCLAFSGHAEESLPHYDTLLTANPSDLEVRLARCRALAWKARYAEALIDAEWAVNMFPGNAEAWWTLGDVRLWSGEPDSAIAAYYRCQALDPNFKEALSGREKADAAIRERNEKAARDRQERPAAEGEGSIYGTQGYPWRIGAEFSGQILLDGRVRQNFALSLRRAVGAGYLNLESGAGQRYGRWEKVQALEGYFTTWRGSYINLRVQVAPGAIYLPLLDYHGEVFQSFLSRFEVSAKARQMVYDGDAVAIFGASGAVYLGPWYLRGSASATAESAPTWSYALLTRRYLGHPDEFAELRAGWGESEKTWRVGGSTGYFLSARLQSLLWEHLGGAFGLQYGKEAGLGKFWEITCGAFVGF